MELAVRRGSLDCMRLSLTPPTLPCTRDAQEGFGPECVIFRADGPPVATWPPVLPACATASWRWRGPSGVIARRFQASSWETGNSPPWRFVTSSFGRASGAGWGPRKGQRAPGLPPLPLGSHVPRALEPGEGGGGRGRGSAGPVCPREGGSGSSVKPGGPSRLRRDGARLEAGARGPPLLCRTPPTRPGAAPLRSPGGRQRLCRRGAWRRLAACSWVSPCPVTAARRAGTCHRSPSGRHRGRRPSCPEPLGGVWTAPAAPAGLGLCPSAVPF